MIRRPPRSTRVRSSAASDVYKRQGQLLLDAPDCFQRLYGGRAVLFVAPYLLSLIHISEPTRLLSISYAVFCLKKKKKQIKEKKKKKNKKKKKKRKKKQNKRK